jgi:hypothetical protein
LATEYTPTDGKWAGLVQNFKDLHFLVPWTGRELKPIPTLDDLEAANGHEPAPADSYNMIHDLIPRGVSYNNFMTALNEFSSLAVDGTKFRTGKTRIIDLVAPVNRRGNVRQLIRDFRAFSVGNGVKFWDSPMQTVGVLAARYFRKRPKAPATEQKKTTGRKGCRR